MRVPVPTQASIKIVDATGGRKGFSIQNVGAVDVYYSDDQRLLDSVTSANLPTAGHLLAASAPVPPPVVYPWFASNGQNNSGKIFARAQGVGAQLEVLIYDVDLPCK